MPTAHHARAQDSQGLVGPLHLQGAPPIEELAAKIQVPVEALKETVAKNNEYAKTGVDPEFGRGSNIYDQFFGDPDRQPNPSHRPDRDRALITPCRSTSATSAPRAG